MTHPAPSFLHACAASITTPAPRFPRRPADWLPWTGALSLAGWFAVCAVAVSVAHLVQP